MGWADFLKKKMKGKSEGTASSTGARPKGKGALSRLAKKRGRFGGSRRGRGRKRR